MNALVFVVFTCPVVLAPAIEVVQGPPLLCALVLTYAASCAIYSFAYLLMNDVQRRDPFFETLSART